MSEILRSFSKEYGWERYEQTIKSLAKLSDEELEALTGPYMLRYDDQELVLEISVLENRLKGVQLWDNVSFEMYPESPTSFFNKEDGTGFEFSMDANGNVVSFTVYEGGQEWVFRKI